MPWQEPTGLPQRIQWKQPMPTIVALAHMLIFAHLSSLLALCFLGMLQTSINGSIAFMHPTLEPVYQAVLFQKHCIVHITAVPHCVAKYRSLPKVHGLDGPDCLICTHIERAILQGKAITLAKTP